MDSSLPEKKEDPKTEDHLPLQRRRPRAPRDEENRRKNNKLILEAKTRRKSAIN